MICFKLLAKIWGDSPCAILIILLLAKSVQEIIPCSAGKSRHVCCIVRIDCFLNIRNLLSTRGGGQKGKI